MSNILKELEKLYDELHAYFYLRRHVIVQREDLTSEEAKRANDLHDSITEKLGAFKDLISEATGVPQMANDDVWISAVSYSHTPSVVNALDQVIQATSIALGKIRTDIKARKRDARTGESLDKPRGRRSEPPKAFVAHEGETKHLDKLRDFLDALGIKPVIAETEASDGRSIERQVDWTQAEADFAVCLATRGKAINKKSGKHYMGLNVADELGRARQVFGNKIILLVQEGVDVHTNTREIVHAKFTAHSMDGAFVKILKELRNWGFVQAAKVQTS